jgi:hypothetical protein
VPVAIASGAARVEIEGVLESSGLRALFPVLVCLEDVQRGKPDPQGYLMARDALAAHIGRPLPAEQVLVFEDSEQGLRAALAAGMQCLVIEGTAPAERRNASANTEQCSSDICSVCRSRPNRDMCAPGFIWARVMTSEAAFVETPGERCSGITKRPWPTMRSRSTTLLWGIETASEFRGRSASQ